MIFAWGLCALILLKLILDTDTYKIGPTPTSRGVKKHLFEITDRLNPTSIVDLGSGFGFLSLALAKRYPQKIIYSIEAAFVPYCFSCLLKLLSNQQNWVIQRADFFKLDSLKGELIYCFLYHDKKGLIASHLKKIATGKKVVSSTFSLNLELLEKKQVSDLYQTPIYLFQVIDF
jgi:hypothetical protein